MVNLGNREMVFSLFSFILYEKALPGAEEQRKAAISTSFEQEKKMVLMK
jgi:hypothetical protein